MAPPTNIAALLDSDADIDARDEDGHTPLDWACMRKDSDARSLCAAAAAYLDWAYMRKDSDADSADSAVEMLGKAQLRR